MAILLASQSSFASAASNNECRSDGADAVITFKAAALNEYAIVGRSDICDNGYEIVEDKPSGVVYLLAAPMELGLRAKRQVFRIDAVGEKVTNIGEIPASAERVTESVFVDSYQEGASVFQEKYKIEKDRVAREPASLELIFDGSVCTSAPTAIYNPRLTVGQGCKRVVNVVPSRPVCILHKGATSKIAPIAKCAPLRALIG
jgi:hypothetical protein